MFYAHSGEPWEPLADHLHDVAERAASFASAFGAAEEARLAGLLHDLGKYSELFSLRLAGKEHHRVSGGSRQEAFRRAVPS